MTPDARSGAAVRPQDEKGLDQALQVFSNISESLLESYEALAERAQRVDEELACANLELESKVGELDGVKRHLEAVLRSLPTGVVVRDSGGRIVRVNDAAVSILGVPAEELVGSRTHAALAGMRVEGEPRELVRSDGTRLVLASRLSNVIDADGAVVGSVEILDDRTEMTALAERVHAMDKMAALGTMGAGIAHELRNPLNAVKGFARLLLRELPGSENGGQRTAKALHWAERIDEGASEADAIITGLLSFARPERVDLSVVDGAELLAAAVAGALPPGEERERWSVKRRCDAPPFRGDRIKLRHALRNLVANAVQAQPDGGEVEVDLARRGDEIVATVRDGGPGIPADERGRVLDPFFTTRAEGTGLGLALVATIARLHGGGVEVAPGASSLGGAEVSLRIPYQPADGPAGRTPRHEG